MYNDFHLDSEVTILDGGPCTFGIESTVLKIVDLEPEAMKDLSFACKSEVDNLLMVLGAENNGKASLSVAVSEGLTQQKGLNAGQIIREIAKEINGGGGGQAFFATAGGKSPEGLQNALTKTRDLLK